MEWIKIDQDKPGEIPENICCWCFDTLNDLVVFFDEDEYIETGRYTHYMKVEKPESPVF